MILGNLLQNEAHIKFINDPQLFCDVSNEYLTIHYKYVLHLINDEFMYLKIYNRDIDIFHDCYL